jgi:hypothetical protein
MKYVATVELMLGLGCPRPLRATETRKDDVFGNRCAQHD